MTDEMTSYLAPVIKPSSKYYNDFVVALQQAQASIPEAAPPTRNGGSAGRAGRDAAGAAANGGTAPASWPPSGGGGGSGSRGSKAHARKWGSLAGGRGVDASLPSSARARRPSPAAAGATGRGGTAQGTPVTPAKSGGSGAGASDDAERPRKRAKATPARSTGRGAAPAAGGSGGRRKVGPSRRGLQSALVAAQAELSVLRESLATAEAASTTVTEPLTWEGIKGALKKFDLHSELPTAAASASARARDRRATVRDGAAGDDVAGVDRYEVPKSQRMVNAGTTEELKEAVNAIFAAGKRIGAAAAAADQQRAAFQAVLDAIPLRGAAVPAAGGAPPAAAAVAAASVPLPAADAGVAAANSGTPSSGRTVRDAAAAATVGGVPAPPPTAACGAIPAEVAEAAHMVAFADQFKEWAVLRAEWHAAEDALEAAVRRVIAMKVTLVQLSESQAGKPVRVTFQRYYKISPAVDILCTALIDQWMEFISQATMQDLSAGTLAKPRPSVAAAPPPGTGGAADTPGPQRQAEGARPLPPATEAEAGGQQAGRAPTTDDAVGGKAGRAPSMAVAPRATDDVVADAQVATADGQANPRPPGATAPSGTATPVPPSPAEPTAAATAAGTATYRADGGGERTRLKWGGLPGRVTPSTSGMPPTGWSRRCFEVATRCTHARREGGGVKVSRAWQLSCPLARGPATAMAAGLRFFSMQICKAIRGRRPPTPSPARPRCMCCQGRRARPTQREHRRTDAHANGGGSLLPPHRASVCAGHGDWRTVPMPRRAAEAACHGWRPAAAAPSNLVGDGGLRQ